VNPTPWRAKLGRLTLIVLATVFCLFPIYFMLVQSLKTAQEDIFNEFRIGIETQVLVVDVARACVGADDDSGYAQAPAVDVDVSCGRFDQARPSAAR
jgi:ABC-type glycerol-3-phosphate transport system permease component